MKEKVIAIIPARGGSKGVYKKNIALVGGKPLITYTIEAALNSKIFSRIIVTTDSEEIANLASEYGVGVLERPKELATDTASSIDVISHVLGEIQQEEYSHFVLLQPTSPLRTARHIQKAWELYNTEMATTLVSVAGVDECPQKMLVREGDSIFPLTSYEDLVKPRQQLAKAYLPNGAIYICKISNFLHSRCLFEEKISLFEMSGDESIDIDANDDIRKAERILKEFKMDNKIIKIDNEEIVDIPSENASRARQLYKEEKFLSAIEIFSCKEKRSFFEAIEIIGVCYFKLQRFDETVKYLSKSINKFPVKSSKQAWLYLFNSYFKMNNNVMCFEVAIEALKYKKVDARMAKAVLEAFCMLEESKYLAVVNKIYPLYDEFCYKNNLKVPQRFTQAYAKYNYSLKETYNKKPVDISMEILDKFEVLVPTYQRKEAIISTIRNIKEVNKWIHMRVVDNASTDGTYEALQELAKEYPNLYVSQNEENLGYAGSMVRLLKECSRKFGIFTSDEEPIIVENTIKAIQYMIDDNIDFLSSQFFRKNSFFRGKANNYLMSPEEYMRASFFTSGIIFNMNLLQKYQDIIVKHTPRKQVYPEIIFAIVASIFGKCFWFNLPTAYILKYQLPTHSHDDTEEKSYTCLIERWRQFQRFMQFFQELFQETIEEKYKARIDSVMRHSASEIFFGLKNAAKREYKTLSEYF